MVEAGSVAPKFSVDGRQIPDRESVLVFYKTTCPTCKFTLPFLHRLSLPILGISQDDAVSTAKFEVQFGVKIDSVLDPAGDEYRVSNAYGIHHVPTFFVVDGSGIVKERIEGFDKDALERLGLEFSEAERVPDFKPG